MIIETCPKCGEPLMDIMLTSNPPISRKECWKCGWSWTGEPERIEYKPFELEDKGKINPLGKSFRWKMIEEYKDND